MRIAILVLQPNLDRNIRKICRSQGLTALGEVSPDRQNLRLARGEIHVERIGLNDGCERSRSARADQGADIDLMISDGAVKGSKDPGVAEVDGRGFDVGLIN